MGNQKVRMTIVFDINEEMLQETGLSAEDVLKDIYLDDDDVRDGFTIGTIIEGFEPTSDFFLENGAVVEKKLIEREKSLDEQINNANEQKNDFQKGDDVEITREYPLGGLYL